MSRINNICELLRSADESHHTPHRITLLVNAQKLISEVLREELEHGQNEGMSWADIGRLCGLPRETVFRQYQSGGPISVVRPTHRKEKTEI